MSLSGPIKSFLFARSHDIKVENQLNIPFIFNAEVDLIVFTFNASGKKKRMDESIKQSGSNCKDGG